MRRIRMVGVSLVALFAVMAVAASTAFGAAPEFGRCVAKAGGKYATSSCDTEVAGKTKFEWEPGPGAKNGFKSAIKVGTKATLETEGKTKVTCTGETSNGEIASAKEVAGVVAHFTGCESSSLECKTTGDAAGEIVTKSLSGVIGFEKKEPIETKDKLAEELHGEGAENIDAEFSCGPFKIVVKGSVLHPIKDNKMVSTSIEKFTAKAGEQVPEAFIPPSGKGEKDEHHLESSLEGGPFEESGQTITANVTFEEKIEANSIA